MLEWDYWVTDDVTETSVPSGYLEELDCVLVNGRLVSESNWQDSDCHELHGFVCEHIAQTNQTGMLMRWMLKLECDNQIADT